jgi:hypothetical protein
MIVVAHQAVRMDYCVISVDGRFEILQELLTILLTFKYVFALVPP